MGFPTYSAVAQSDHYRLCNEPLTVHIDNFLIVRTRVAPERQWTSSFFFELNCLLATKSCKKARGGINSDIEARPLKKS